MRTRLLMALTVGLVAGICVFTAVAGLSRSLPLAALTAVAAAGVVAWGLWMRPPMALDEAAASRGLKVVSGLAALAALVLLGRLAVFMVDPSQTSWSIVPSSQFEVRHSCLSAYFVAAKAAPRVPDIYDNALYSAPDDDPAAPRKALRLGAFNIDAYEYPPTFLLLPRAFARLTPEFTDLRPLWFSLNTGLVLLALLVIARFLGPTVGTRALLLSPLVFAALPTISTLQKGNVQLVIIALSMLAMVLFERRRFALGGLLLAFAIVSKLYPGMLLVYLLARRQWRAFLWTCALSGALALATLLDVGWAPFAAFLHHLPAILGGEAFPAFRNPGAVAINYSVPGLVFKLKLFGVAGMSFATAKLVGWLYTLFAIGATLALASRSMRQSELPAAWLAILFLATLRSPFLPQTYAVFPALWVLTLAAATVAPSRKKLLLMLLAWLSLCAFLPVDAALDPRLKAVIALLPQAMSIAVVWGAVRRRQEAESPSWASPELEPA